VFGFGGGVLLSCRRRLGDFCLPKESTFHEIFVCGALSTASQKPPNTLPAVPVKTLKGMLLIAVMLHVGDNVAAFAGGAEVDATVGGPTMSFHRGLRPVPLRSMLLVVFNKSSRPEFNAL